MRMESDQKRNEQTFQILNQQMEMQKTMMKMLMDMKK